MNTKNWYLLAGLLLLLGACNNKNAVPGTTENNTASAPAVSPNIVLAAHKDHIIGKWAFGHEPFVLEFRADGTYYEYHETLPEDNSIINTNKPNVQGQWTFQPGAVTIQIRNEAGVLEESKAVTPIYTMTADYIFLGDFETEYGSSGEDAGAKEDYFTEFGYVKMKGK